MRDRRSAAAAAAPRQLLRLRLLLPLLLVALACAIGPAAGEDAPAPLHPADLSACPNLRIAVINGVPFHYEVLAGLLHVLQPYAPRTDVYLNRYTRSSNADGAWELLRWSKATFHLLTRELADGPLPYQYDLVVLVSTDYELDAAAELLRRMRPRLVVALVHNADFQGIPRLLSAAAGLAAGASSSAVVGAAGAAGAAAGPSVQLLTLSPHVAASLAAASGQPAGWALPTYPFNPITDCLAAPESELLGRCLRGFSLQGKLSNLRRNYTAVWQQLLAHREALTSGDAGRLFHVFVAGKGPNRLSLPPELEPHVTLLRRLRFHRFYEAIHHTLALLPALASPRYLTDKFTSTIITSLTSGTPMLADARFLAAYSMLGPESVYLQHEGESEAEAMLRLMSLPAADLLAVRRGLRTVRKRLNDEASTHYAKLLRGLCGGGGK
ncbi:hypothetical protein TSOC_011247 [Tetrabaena socialis]|uniref:Uncharacterized protein n=1 Tax=Tetrabaena socialis TaxID=47790 RepID=A0A2J7ZR71_9CHLO|nr:hypothetical protein TSOC_011247 [Tetrabaena socialis]|eukprot:PNH02740.1 hypothetical protein TSOC_011247 [Tetrabaena socialis]